MRDEGSASARQPTARQEIMWNLPCIAASVCCQIISWHISPGYPILARFDKDRITCTVERLRNEITQALFLSESISYQTMGYFVPNWHFPIAWVDDQNNHVLAKTSPFSTWKRRCQVSGEGREENRPATTVKQHQHMFYPPLIRHVHSRERKFVIISGTCWTV